MTAAKWYRTSRMFGWLLAASALNFAVLSFFDVLPPLQELGSPWATPSPSPSPTASPTQNPQLTFPTDLPSPMAKAAFGGINISLLALFISLAALLVSLTGTTSAMILGWRSERRRAAEFKLKMEQHERETARERAKAKPR